MLHNRNWTFKWVFGLNWCQFTLGNYQKSKKATQRPDMAKSTIITITLCCATIIGHSSVSLALIGINLHQKIIKSLKRPFKDQKRPSQKWLLKLLCGIYTFWLEMHPKVNKWYRRLGKFEIARKAIQRPKRPINNDCYNCYRSLTLFFCKKCVKQKQMIVK
jgi:hypothetical protein